MRILLDECVPRRLGRELAGHDVRTVPEMGWSSKRNGELLQLMAAQGFEVFLTVDQNLWDGIHSVVCSSWPKPRMRSCFGSLVQFSSGSRIKPYPVSSSCPTGPRSRAA